MLRPEETGPRAVSVASDSFGLGRSTIAPAERKRSRPDAENGGGEVSSCSPMRPRRAKRGEGSRLDQQSRAGEGRHNLPPTPTPPPPRGAREPTSLSPRSLPTHFHHRHPR